MMQLQNSYKRIPLFALGQILMFYGFVFNNWIPFPFTFIIITLGILLLTYFTGRNFGEIGLTKKDSFAKVLMTALALFILIEPVFDFLIQPLVNKLTNEIPDYSMFEVIRNQPLKFLKFLLYMWLSAAIGEEILFRGFLFARLKEIMPAFRYKSLSIMFISATLFSLPHIYQGPSGLVITFIYGLIFGAVYIRSGYNLWVVIILHGLVDTLFLSLAYCGGLGFYEIANKYFFGY